MPHSRRSARPPALAMTLALALPAPAHAAAFFTDFEGLNEASAGCFEVTDGGLTARFDGGTAFTIGNGALYRSGSVSWMVDPAGTHGSRGTSTGTGTLTLAEPAQSLSAWIRNEDAGVLTRARALDTTGGVVAESTAFNATGWTEFAPSVPDGAALIEVVELINEGGGGMNAMDDLSFTTPGAAAGTPGNCPDGGAPPDNPYGGGDTYAGGGGGSYGGGAAAPGLLLGFLLLGLSRRAPPRPRPRRG